MVQNDLCCVVIVPLTKQLQTLQEKQHLPRHLSGLISPPAVLFRTEHNPFIRLEYTDTATEQKEAKSEASQNLGWVSNLNKHINISFEAAFHRC